MTQVTAFNTKHKIYQYNKLIITTGNSVSTDIENVLIF